jgi:hypothetical protein
MEKGLSIDFITDELEWSVSKLTRIENGQVGISKVDLDALMRTYGVTDDEYIAGLQDLARASRQRTWWSKYQRVIAPSLAEFIGAESDASSLWYIQPLILPTLLQTRAYAAAVNAVTVLKPMADDVAEARVEVRLRRQKEILSSDGGRRIVVIVDEAVLRRLVGGTTIAREQLDHIVEIADPGVLELVVLPFNAGAHFGMLGPFTLLGYDDPQDSDVVYLENAVGGLIVRDDPDVVGDYHAAATRLMELGIRGREAVNFVRDIRKELV